MDEIIPVVAQVYVDDEGNILASDMISLADFPDSEAMQTLHVTDTYRELIARTARIEYYWRYTTVEEMQEDKNR